MLNDIVGYESCCGEVSFVCRKNGGVLPPMRSYCSFAYAKYFGELFVCYQVVVNGNMVNGGLVRAGALMIHISSP